ncbi:MAG: SMP-30/gluconolactonase/LRE family protein [Tannerella sp.]|nr:SMP-30/gluconolactonase/LRE family protein [Tannerella sp.]
MEHSEIFPGTTRQIDVYVPVQYDGKTPACVCIFQDNMGFKADTVVSNLIDNKEIPVMILVAASPGSVGGDFDPDNPRANRTYEYDTPSPQFGRFVLEELLPLVETLKAQDGRTIKLSRDRNDRMITGCSSGAACAFNVAWYTDEFARVYSACGSFTGLRGSYGNATLVNKFEPKPIRLFLQSGSHDMWTCFGDWWTANQAMVRALQFSGYDFDYEFTENAGHCDIHAARVFPKAMRFLWNGYPDNQPSPVTKTRNHVLNEILEKDEAFQPVTSVTYKEASLVTGTNGRVYLTYNDKSVLLHENNEPMKVISDDKILAVGKDDRVLAYHTKKGLMVRNSGSQTLKKITTEIIPSHAVALKSGGFYITGAKNKNENPQYLWLLTSDHKLIELDSGLKGACALALSANENWLYVFEYDTRRGFNYKVKKEDEHVALKQEFFFIHLPDECDGAETSSAICDNSGKTYLATAMGIQVCDFNGRSAAILSLPENIRPRSIAWGGEKRNILYVLCENGSIYKRILKTQGPSIEGPMPVIRVGAG